MVKFIIRRLVQAVPTMIGITVLVFWITSLTGSPLSQLTLDPTSITPKQRSAMEAGLGLYDPWPVQYLRWLIGDAPIQIGNITLWNGRELPTFDRRGNQMGTAIGTSRGILRGDFGKSFISRNPVTEVLSVRIGPTLELGLLALALGSMVGITIGILAAVNQGGIFDNFTRVMAVVVSSVPIFYLGIILLLVFAFWLNLLPPGNRLPLIPSGEGGTYTLWDRMRHLILPTFTLGSISVATFSRFMRASLLDVLGQDYVRTARAKGLANRAVWFKHAARNALIPIATLLGPAIPGVISGAILTETIYAWPGMGLLLNDSVKQRDFPVIMAIVLLLALASICGYLLSDILYALIDPRIRLN